MSSVGRGRTPSAPIVAADERHLQRRREHLALADRRGADGEVVADLARRRGIVERAAPASGGSSLKPNFSAVATSFSAPSLAPSGAKTLLHECAKEVSQRAAAGLAVGVLDLDALDRRRGLVPGSVALRLATLFCSTPASVTILNVEPGGCGADWAIPASASTSPVCGPHDRDPAVAAGERLDRGALDLRVDRRAHRRRPARRLRWRARARRRNRMPPGVPVRRSSNSRSRPVRPTAAPVGHAARGELGRARSGGAGPTVPAISRGERSEVGQAVRALGERGAVAGLDRRARRQRRLAPELLAAAQAGVDELGAPVDAGVGVLALAASGATSMPLERAEDARLERDRRPSVVVGAPRPVRTCVSVSVSAACA